MTTTTRPQTTEITRPLIDTVRAYRYEDLPDDVVTVARQCLLDWLGVALAGSGEQLTRILREEALEQGGREQATLVGTGVRVSTGQAALVNGAASHALDFDDVQLLMSGHPSVPVIPALLALAEARGAGGRAFITAFVAGVETECRIGALVMPGHYATGFHATGTLGTFGAVAACAHLLGLDEGQWATALGIAGTQASGLKSMFGTMCKPLHAGKAAANGLLAATLAARGFTSNGEVLETAQGFSATHTDTVYPERLLEGLGESFAIRDVLFKYHAACYGTHAGIEALVRLRERHGFTPEEVQSVTLRVPPGHLAMCNIAEPRTALEGKFSLRFTAALALAGPGTGEAAFTDARTHEPALVALRDRVSVEADPTLGSAMATTATVRLANGATCSETADTEAPERDLSRQGDRLAAKFRGLAAAVLGAEQTAELLAAVDGLESVSSMATIARLSSPHASTPS